MAVLAETLPSKFSFAFCLLLSLWFFSAMVAAIPATKLRMAAMPKLQLNGSAPFVGLAFVLVLIPNDFILPQVNCAAKFISLSVVRLGILIGRLG